MPGTGPSQCTHWWLNPDPGLVLSAGGDRLTPASLPRCAFFHGEIDKPAQGFLHRGGRKPVSVAISLDGVHVIDCREKVRPAPPGGTWSGNLSGEAGSGVLTQAFLVPWGLWLALGQGGQPFWPPSLRCLWGFHCRSGGFAEPTMGQLSCPACRAWR